MSKEIVEAVHLLEREHIDLGLELGESAFDRLLQLVHFPVGSRLSGLRRKKGGPGPTSSKGSGTENRRGV